MKSCAILYVNAMTVKDIALRIINDLPEDASYDEVIAEIQFRKMVELGIQDSKDNKVISTAKLRQEITKW